MRGRTVITLVFCGFSLLAAGCIGRERSSTNRTVAVEPEESGGTSTAAAPPAAKTAPDVPAFPPGYVALAGEFAIQTPKGYYLTAIDGGGRSTAPVVVTVATSAGAWERFRVVVANPPTDHDKSFQTASGNYLTAVNGGGRITNALHTDATQIGGWEQFRLLDLSVGFAPTYY